MDTQPELARRLSTGDAVVLGLGSMLGAGVFAAFTPAAEAAGDRRRWPRPLQVVGAVGCVVLVVTLPVAAIAGGSAVVLASVLYRGARLRLGGRPG